VGSFRRTLLVLRPYRWQVVAAVLLTLAVTVLQLAPPRLFQWAIDAGVKPAMDGTGTDPAERVLLWAASGVAVVVALRSLLNYVLSVLVAWVGHRFCFDLRFMTWRHLQRLSLAFHRQTQTGKIMSRATGDIELIQGLIQGQLVTFLSDLVTLVAVVGMLFWLEWRVAAMILALVPFYVVSYLAFLKPIRAMRQEQRRLWDEMVGRLTEKISAIGVVKAFVREKAETEAFMSIVRRRFDLDVRQMHLNRRLGLVSGVVSALGTGLVYSYGGWLVQTRQMTVGELVAVTFYIGFVFNPAVRVVDFNTQLQWAVAAMDRVFETLDTRPDIADRPDARPLPRFEREIAFEGVSFSAGGTEVLKDVSLVVRKGETIGVVGKSGAGKTTLMNLLMRFMDPTRGRVTIDGHDLREVRLDSVRRQMSMVAQENVVFSATVAENVRYGSRDATDAQVEAACRAADLHDFVTGLEDGYETVIGERGVRFSGGQRQRLALARALVTDPAILILDDVTSALDGETEAKVQEALAAVMRGRTTFVVAHRLSSVVTADRIVVLEAGRIVDIGTHQELVSRPGPYRDLYDEQFRGALPA
jgi:ABC-type multidrug transport system fused ATPase/permease subunit